MYEDGIGLKFEVADLHFIDPPECKAGLDGPRELNTRRRLNRFLIGALRQAWRLKRHQLQTTDDLRPLVTSIPRLPVKDLIGRVVDLVEDRSRRIVDIDCDNNALVCPLHSSVDRLFVLFSYSIDTLLPELHSLLCSTVVLRR